MYRVLLVDDEYYFRKGLLQLVPWAACGFVVAGEAKNGREALALLEQEHFDLLFLDINMPVMSGLELLERLPAHSRSELRVVLLTGYSEFAYAQKALRHGVFDYLLKPVEAADVTAVLRRLQPMLPGAGGIVVDKPKCYGELRALQEQMRELYAETYRAIADNLPPDTPGQEIYKQAVAFIHEHYHRPTLTETEIAGAVYVSPGHLCSVFKKAGGTTVIRYLSDYRMLRARERFDAGSCLVQDVAERVGFQDANYFGKCFKRYFGVPPSRYIQMVRETREN